VSAQDQVQPVFFYDITSPDCYLAAETIMASLPVVPEWEPVLAPEIGANARHVDRAWILHRAAEVGLQPVRWPDVWPAAPREATLAATYAKRVGRAVAFSLAAFRQAFAGGRDLGEQSTVLIAGAACEMHPTALLKGMTLRSTAEALAEANRRACAAGVRTLPAIQVDGVVFEGEDAIQRAAGALAGPR
jgi:2-hydroxychromene-2-carboxylate isomerase